MISWPSPTGCGARSADTELGRAIPAVIAAAAGHPEVAEAHRSFVATRRAVAVGAVRRGIERGEVDEAVDPDTLLDMVVGPLFHRQLINRRPVTEQWIREVVAHAVRGCAPSSGPSRAAVTAD